MSSDKRRRARVQGGWASPAKGSSSNDSKVNKPEGPVGDLEVPAWTGKNAADPAPTQKFVYEEPTEEFVAKPKETTIEKSGIYDISTEPEGTSRIRFFTNFIDKKNCSWMEEQLIQELPWKQRSDVKNGQEYLQPRLTAWFGDLPYTYSGVTHAPNPHWTSLLRMLKDRLEEKTGFQYNSMLANLYRDGHDHVPWHADDEPGLGPNPTIASLSFGDTRMFELRRNPPPEQRLAGDFSRCEIVRVPLDAGSLIIMEGRTQEDWQHRIAKEYHDRGARINLTFRVIYPED